MLSLLLQLAAGSSPVPRLYVQARLPLFPPHASGSLEGREGRIRSIKSLGFQGVAIAFEWARIEAQRGRPSWSRMDSVVDEAGAAHLRMFGLIAYAPQWAVPVQVRSLPRIDAHRPVVDGSAAKGDTLFAAFAAAVVRRYGSRIMRWEIWNEENNPAFWFNDISGANQGPAPADYLRLFSLAQDSMLAANSNIEISVGGLASFGGRVYRVSDPQNPASGFQAMPSHLFLRELIRLGLRPSAVAIHPYSVVPPGQRRPGEAAPVFPDQVIDSVSHVLDEAGLSKVPLWVTEWGVNSRLIGIQTDLDRWYAEGLHLLLCNPRISFVTIYTLTDANETTDFDLLLPQGAPSRTGRALLQAEGNGISC